MTRRKFPNSARWGDFWKLLPLLFDAPLVFGLACAWLIGLKTGAADRGALDEPLYELVERLR